MHLLKPARVDVLPGQQDVVCADDMQPLQAWLEYPYRKSHPILRWLPSKLAAWIGENFEQELHIHDTSQLVPSVIKSGLLGS